MTLPRLVGRVAVPDPSNLTKIIGEVLTQLEFRNLVERMIPEEGCAAGLDAWWSQRLTDRSVFLRAMTP